MYISRPSEKLQISAVSQDCETVRYIEEPCEKAVIVALKENPGLFMYIHNSSPSKVITTLVEKDMEKRERRENRRKDVRDDVMRHYAEGLGKELDGAPEYPFPFFKGRHPDILML